MDFNENFESRTIMPPPHPTYTLFPHLMYTLCVFTCCFSTGHSGAWKARESGDFGDHRSVPEGAGGETSGESAGEQR